MQDKVSVYNNPMGGAQAPPPPRPASKMLFQRDGYIPPAPSMDDIRIELHHKKQNEILVKYFKMLLSSIFPKWQSESNVPRLPKAPIQRKERVEKRVDFQIAKKIEDKSDQLLIAVGKGLQPLFKPPYKLAMAGLDLLGKGLVKGEELLDKVLIKTIVEPLIYLKENVLPPLQKAATYISEKFEMTLLMLEREGERVIEFVIAPLSEALETVQTVLTKLYTPLKKGKNWLAKKMPSIPKPSLSFEPLERMFIKPFKVFINTFIAIPLARGIQKIAEPIKQGSQFLAKKGSMAYVVLSNFCRAVGAKVGKYLESFFRKVGRFLAWLFKLLLAFSYRVGHLLLKFSKYLSKWTTNLYLASCRLTQWAASRFTRN